MSSLTDQGGGPGDAVAVTSVHRSQPSRSVSELADQVGWRADTGAIGFRGVVLGRVDR